MDIPFINAMGNLQKRLRERTLLNVLDKRKMGKRQKSPPTATHDEKADEIAFSKKATKYGIWKVHIPYQNGIALQVGRNMEGN